MKLLLKRAMSIGMAASMVMLSGEALTQKVYAAQLSGKEDAIAIEVGDEIEDSLSVKTEEDWYEFTTPATDSGVNSWFKITQEYSNKKENGYPPSVYLYDEKENELLHVSPGYANREEYGYIILEAESTYYIMVTSEYHNDTADYRFTVTELMDEAGESLEQAVDLETNMIHRFELQSYDDEDWFYIESMNLKPTITVKNRNVQALTIEVYDLDGVKLDVLDVDTGEKDTLKLDLEEKEFYLRIYSYYSTELSVGNYTVEVNDLVNVTKVSLNKSKVELKPGKSLTLKATVSPMNATNQSVIWKSSNSRIATVNQAGKVVAKRTGTVTITCTAKDGSNKKATCRITVKR